METSSGAEAGPWGVLGKLWCQRTQPLLSAREGTTEDTKKKKNNKHKGRLFTIGKEGKESQAGMFKRVFRMSVCVHAP